MLLELDFCWRWRGLLLLPDERKNSELFSVFLVAFRTRTITVPISVRLVHVRSSMRTDEDSKNSLKYSTVSTSGSSVNTSSKKKSLQIFLVGLKCFSVGQELFHVGRRPTSPYCGAAATRSATSRVWSAFQYYYGYGDLDNLSVENNNGTLEAIFYELVVMLDRQAPVRRAVGDSTGMKSLGSACSTHWISEHNTGYRLIDSSSSVDAYEFESDIYHQQLLFPR